MYKAMYDTEGEIEFGNIREITAEQLKPIKGKCDIVTAGFVCQPFSLSGKRGGFQDDRGDLFFEVTRILKEINPSIVLLENVQGLLSSDKGRDFGAIIHEMDECGYIFEWAVLNAKSFSLPTNRRRLIMLGVRKDLWVKPTLYPLLKEADERPITKTVMDILEHPIDESLYYGEKTMNSITYHETLREEDVGKGVPIKDATPIQKYLVAETGDTVNTSYPKSNTRRGRVIKQLAPAIEKSNCDIGVMLPDGLKRLSPREAWRIHGFPDESFDKAAAISSKTRLYETLGNSVPINMIQEVIHNAVLNNLKEL